MKWFEGPIPEAIKSAKEKGAVFVVYIYGKFLIPEVMWEFGSKHLGFSDASSIHLSVSS